MAACFEEEPMSIHTPICPARAIYERIERLEARREALCTVAKSVQAGEWLRRDLLLGRLDDLDQALILEGERARDDLAEAMPVTSEGAVCQLIAAMRDVRSGDAEMMARARRMMDRSASFGARSAQD
jgi:hypothetical protein